MGVHELTALIWREREILDQLLYKLEVEQLLLLSGKTRRLPLIVAEIEHVTKLSRELSLARTVEVAIVGAEWGTGPEPTLQDLCACAPEGAWKDIFDAHLAGLLALTSEVQRVKNANEQYLSAASRSTQETVAGVGMTSKTYDSRGHTGAADGIPVSRLFDREI